MARDPAPTPRPSEPVSADAIDATIGRRLRLLREARRMPLAGVALSLGKSVGYLSQVERGLSSLPVRDLARIAELLGVDFLSLVSPTAAGEGASPIRRAADTRPVTFHSSGITKTPLAPSAAGELRLFLMTLDPGSSTGTDLYSHDGEEAGLVLEGSIRLTIGTETHALAQGDSFRFTSSTPHGFANAARGRSVVLWVNSRR
ncbi:Helix-turn-helix domain-containing protein [Roseomonas rosea]|uniref:Helix-turn-helix domain-containing protein n=1 Tax=Muricoccus roseus TaxID=198092 RepID=A0A1M6HI39_9PROT|nr:cupin domain-containing protein [Roseomonas rosea]SHJ21863.1 Helix-turn-helix domain-containing protein [Roseomonas rosea]